MTAEALLAHLQGGTSTVCRAWTVTLRSGVVMGFTDHDRDLVVDGVPCRADTGLTARALQQTTGLSVDNSEAVGALSDAAIREADLVAGRYDGAEVRAYLVNWAAPDERVEQFRGNLGEITRAGPAFRAELRGLSAQLNRAQGFAYQRGCSAILGDARCRFDISQPGYFADLTIAEVEEGRLFRFGTVAGFDERWFEHGRFEVMSGDGAGLVGLVRSDRVLNGIREMELWEAIRADVLVGDGVRVIAGCNKTFATCRDKFLNTLNYRGFPHIPGEDLLSSYPVPDRPNPGGPRLLPGFP
jgi:uncharacterized phage protein (TIGR02218 family)